MDPMDCFIKLEQHFIKGDMQELNKELIKALSYDAELGSCCVDCKTSILHIAARAGQVEIISCILENAINLLYEKNGKDDLPIHVAVKARQNDAIMKLLEHENKIVNKDDNQLETKNNDGNTALHIALDNRDESLARQLFDKCPHTFYESNVKSICPLYLAIKNRNLELVKHILGKVDSQGGKDYRRHLDGLRHSKSVLHAAIIAKDQETLKHLINKYPELENLSDENGLTILSNAARIGFVKGVEYLLKHHPKLACKQNEDGSYPFSQACSGGNLKIFQIFFKHFSAMKCSLNNKNQNILHIAAVNGKNDIVKHVLGHKPANKTEALINMKDDDGNTALHLAAMAHHPKVVYTLTADKRVHIDLENDQGLTALDLIENSYDQTSFEERLTWTALLYANVPRTKSVAIVNRDKRLKDQYTDMVNNLILVCTLVTTVTFAANLTMPGGYISSEDSQKQQGMATLAHKHAFQVFVISNTIAMFSSMFSAITLIWAQLDDINLSLKSFKYALPSLACALTMMPIAFMTGSYAVLHTVCNWLAILVLILGGGFSVGALAFFIPLCSPTSHVKSKFMRFLLRILFRMMLLGCSKS